MMLLFNMALTDKHTVYYAMERHSYRRASNPSLGMPSYSDDPGGSTSV